MRKHFSYLLPMLYVWAGLVISGVVWKLIPREPAVELTAHWAIRLNSEVATRVELELVKFEIKKPGWGSAGS